MFIPHPCCSRELQASRTFLISQQTVETTAVNKDTPLISSLQYNLIFVSTSKNLNHQYTYTRPFVLFIAARNVLVEATHSER